MLSRSQIQKAMDKKITPGIWEKETDRFFDMSEKQLTTRLYKITNPVKMEAFRQVALLHGYKKLSRWAAEKRDLFCLEMKI